MNQVAEQSPVPESRAMCVRGPVFAANMALQYLTVEASFGPL